MATAAQGSEVRAGAGMLDHLGATYGSSGEFSRQARPGDGRGEVRAGVLRGDPGAVFVNLGEFASQSRPGDRRGEMLAGVLRGDPGVMNHSPGTFPPHFCPSAGEVSVDAPRGDLGLVHDSSGMFGHQPVGLGAMNADFGQLTPQPQPVDGHGERLVLCALRGDLGLLLHDDPGAFASQFRPVAGRDAEFVNLLPDGHGAVYDNSDNSASQPRPGDGHRNLLGVLYDNPDLAAALRDPNLGAQPDGTLAEHLRRLMPVAGIIATSAAATGLATGTVSAAAGFGFFALLLGGLSLVMIHVLRA